MRLHRLAMTAIGPFAGQVEIDLARFGDSGLFLIEGPTGAGKSTVLDAISFALYGKLAQSSAVIERLKSHHAPPGTEPVVELVFETQSGLYRIRRTPSYERPKKRGAGTITAHMTVKLWRLNSAADLDGGELLSHSQGDAEDEITRAVGLTHAQFVQTVLLPQGEFASFLRADTTSKRALLQRLFGTELLARTQQQLVEGRRDAEQRRASALDSVRQASHALAGAVGLPAEQAGEILGRAEAGDRDGLVAAIAAVESELRVAEAHTAGLHEAATEHRLLADAAAQRGQDLRRRQANRDQLRAEQGRLVAAEAEIGAGRDELAAAERALRVEPAATALATAIQHSDRAQDVQTEARGQLPDYLYGTDESRLREVAAGHRTMIGELAEELRREQRLGTLHTQYEQLTAERDEQLAAIERATKQLATLPAKQAALTGSKEQAVLAASQLTLLIAERDRAQGRLFAARQAETAAREAASNQTLAREVFEAAEGQRVRLESLQASWRATIASELGLALQSGDPCVVCGSVEHPRPARPAPGHVSQDQVRTAENELRRMTTDVESRRSLLVEQQTELIRLQLEAEQLTPELAEGKLNKASAALAEAEANAAKLADIEAKLAAIEQQFNQLGKQVQAAERVEAGLAEQARALQATIEQDELAVHQARFGYDTVVERVADLGAEVELIELAATASAAATAALAHALEAGAVFNAALAEADFDGQQDWQQARRTSSALATLRSRLRDYDEQVLTVAAKLNTPELTDPALDAEAPDLDTLAEAVRLAALAERESTKAHGAATQRCAAAVEHARLVSTAVHSSAEVLAATAPAIRLGNLVAGLGENQLKMELTTYVLVRRFAEIVAAANSQLRLISSGRYQLEHTDARSGNARSGLGLRVLDLHTGRPRDPGTLSGGETFYVSLSLALGLADIVRAESGGIDLGTLFIDEGFGSLDAEVLDQVIAVLDGLRAGGRAVGVVSHVSELKMRIADRIQVIRDVDGSSRLVSTV
ncbi:MAG: AAA family ATPase [Actinomycetota bacterium]|nr:AAA family ATPase [Actinomycetota bacterium]MDQ2955952.1 AAA family ATPase [Actinomycetota bacterium]